jgi:YesN/AraC family two-component response regulator
VIEARNGREGFNMARNNVPDIIISDVMMPDMNGYELCKKVKTTLEISHIPVILLTAKAGFESQTEGYEVGADSYLSKPVKSSVLETRIKSLLEQRQVLKNAFQMKIDLEPDKVILPSLDEKFIKKAKEIIENNIENEQFNVYRLVKEMGTSNSMLYRKISGITGLSPNEFIKNIRLRRAVQLLNENKYSISEVAYYTGFNDQSYFSVCFKKQFGKTPTEFLAEKNDAKK